ncbi:hypothetical protein MKX01_000034 [Papaver californicum]|nr:hypothetical protein MKX01_000034 [Papaver californicum]
MAFHGHHHLFIQPQTVLTLKSLTPALLLHTQHSNTVRRSHVRYIVGSRTTNSTDPLLPRRSANYHPNIWDHEFVESLTSDYKSEMCANRAAKLKENVRSMFVGASGLRYSLKLIVTIQRLGLDYHFHDEIKSALDKIYINGKNYHVSQNDLITVEALNIIRGYKNEGNVVKNFEGLLNLYEASFYAYQGEEILKEAQQFAGKHLKHYLKEKNDNNSSRSIVLDKEVSHSLELPLLWRVPRMEVRWYIDKYGMKQDMQPSLLEFAKLDFNIVQATHHEELKCASRWWRDLAFHESLGFARNRLVECFLWNIGKHVTKICNLVSIIDDVYDVYGSLDELKLFTEAIQRWDIKTVENLPHYMKICFFALDNTVNEMGYEVLRNNDLDVMPYLKKSLASMFLQRISIDVSALKRYTTHIYDISVGDLCKSFLVEATWYYSGYIPTLEEYTNNAWISVAGPVVTIHAYCQLGDQEITKEALECINNNQSDLIRWSSMIFRLADDLATSKNELERGDVAKSIQCYMHETGASESIARKHMKHLISASWEKMNTSLSASRGVFPSSLISIIQNIARMGQYMYQHGDGYGIPNRESKDRIMSIIVKPIPV